MNRRQPRLPEILPRPPPRSLDPQVRKSKVDGCSCPAFYASPGRGTIFTFQTVTTRSLCETLNNADRMTVGIEQLNPVGGIVNRLDFFR